MISVYQGADGSKFLSEGALDAIKRVLELRRSVASVVFGNQEVIEMATLAIVSGHHMVVVGPPGEAKSLLVMEVVRRISGARVFKYQFSQFSTPDHVIGPVSIRALRENDQVVLNTAGRLADCHFFVAEEIFKAGREIHDHLLLALNEREVINPHPVKIPLRSVLGTSNEFPQGEEMAAIRDRIAIRTVVDRPDPDVLRKILRARHLDRLDSLERPHLVSLSDLDLIRGAIEHVYVSNVVLDMLMEIGARLSSMSISVSTRRFRWALDLIRTAALMRGSLTAETSDLDLVKNVFWDAISQRTVVSEVVNEVLGKDLVEISDILNMTSSVVQYYLDCLEGVRNKDEEVSVRADAVTRLRELRARAERISKAGGHAAGEASKIEEMIEEEIQKIVLG